MAIVVADRKIVSVQDHRGLQMTTVTGHVHTNAQHPARCYDLLIHIDVYLSVSEQNKIDVKLFAVCSV